MTYVPKFIIKPDRALDETTIIEFMHAKNPLITQVFPHFTNEQAVRSGIKNVYEDSRVRLDVAVRWLRNNTSILQKLADIIAFKLGYAWDGISTITIIPALSPIAPRFVENSSFLVPFHADHNWILRTSAHEMTHFLYFKKLQDMCSEKINAEYPSADWLISEVVAPIIVNSRQIQQVVHCKDDPLYAPEPDIISDEKLVRIATLFKQSDNLLAFRDKALTALFY